MHGQFINSCLSCSICFFKQILLNSSISWQSFDWFFRKSLFLISNSPYELILLFLSWSARWFACCSCNRWDSNFWLISKRAIQEFLFSQCLTSTSASASYNLCWAIFSPRTANSALRSRILWRFSWLSMFAQRVGLDFSSPLTLTRKTWNNCFTIDVRTKSPWCWSDLQQRRNSPTVSWG